MLLKLFEPSSVRLYLSDLLQQANDSYRKGLFDAAYLADAEKSAVNPNGLAPQRFYDFLVNTWGPDEHRRRRAAERRAKAHEAEEALQGLVKAQGEVKAELSTVESELEEATQSYDAANQNATKLESAITTVEADIEEFIHELQGLRAAKKEIYPRVQARYESELLGRLGQARNALRKLKEHLPAVTNTLGRTTDRLSMPEWTASSRNATTWISMRAR